LNNCGRRSRKRFVDGWKIRERRTEKVTAKEVYSKAKAEGIQIPFVELVTEEESGPFTGGWLS
jgi:hypothetical protein